MLPPAVQALSVAGLTERAGGWHCAPQKPLAAPTIAAGALLSLAARVAALLDQ